jgi:hypothetical protein
VIEPLKFHRSIQEFWIDFLLEEEFRSDPGFARLFAAASGFVEDGARITNVTHSLNDDHGEADLVVELTIDEGCRCALLIENKINAAFQPLQAQRYRDRGDTGIATGRWKSYRTVLVAPARYVRTDHGFDATVTLEQISDWICITEPLRRAFKIERLNRAIEKKNAAGVQLVDDTMTSFRAWYGSRLDAYGAGFVGPAPRPAYRDDNWLEWTSARLPDWCRFRHRTRTGILDLSFLGIAEVSLRALEVQLPVMMRLTAIGKEQRATIAVPIDPITDFANLTNASRIIDDALDLAAQLQDIATANLIALQSIRAERA